MVLVAHVETRGLIIKRRCQNTRLHTRPLVLCQKFCQNGGPPIDGLRQKLRALHRCIRQACAVAIVRRITLHRSSHARSSTLDLALPNLATVPELRVVGEAGHRGPVAPPRLPALLALKVWTAVI
jgi:hypothetical protein